uniref:38.7k n=1 Tax=Erinnyis ello granulovirus TaxID=307444 RepID=A0A288WIN8_9BBAC|nr:38.7k [Erinnyis ello granulovirus]
MSSWLNSIFDYLFGDRLDNIKQTLHLLTQRVNYLYTHVYDKTSDYEEEEYDEDETEFVNKREILTLGIFGKPRHNNHTQLQFVSGTRDVYNTKKSLYSDMTLIVEDVDVGEENTVCMKKLQYTSSLEDAGFDVTHISENSKIVNGHIDDVINILHQQ